MRQTSLRIVLSLLLLLVSSLLRAAEPKIQRAIPYAEPKQEQQTLDVYAPSAGKNHPVAIWIHGGGWHSGDKSDVGSKPQAFVDRGYVFVSINYRLWPGVTIRQIAQDVAKAIRWTHEHVADYGGDPKRLFVLGHSAGAQLAALVCTDERYLKAENLSFALIKGCVPVDGDTYDLPMRFATVRKSGNQKLAERDQQRFGDEQRQKEMSSVTYIARGKHIPPFLILHVADHPDTGGQSRRLFQALQQAGVHARIHAAEGKDHKTINNDLGKPDDKPSQALFEFLHEASKSAQASRSLAPWASRGHPQDVTRRHVEAITAAEQAYRIDQGGTMDGTNCRSPIGGGFGIWDQSWESNRAVRLENIGTTDVINPWLSNGRNDFRSMAAIVARAVRPGMTDRDKATALWRLQTTHRFHAGSGDNEVNDPVKVFNVYGYTTCGNDSICLAGLWQAAGLQVRPARCPGHCISQVFYDGRWHLLDGDMGPFYLLRDNRTIAGEHDLVRDHDLVRRSHTGGILDPDSRTTAEAFAGLFVSENEWKGGRNSVRGTTMNLVLRPGEALVWRWGHLDPVKYHGRTDIKVFGPRKGAAGKVWGAHAAERICNGLWEYRPDFTRDLWRKGADSITDVRSEDGALVPASGKTGTLVWKMRSPYPFVGGALEVQGSGTKFFLSWDGGEWLDVGDNLEAFFHFPHKGDARYAYWLKCELAPGARLERLAIVNDLQMAPLALPGMVVGANRFTYMDQSAGARQVRITHEWVERSLSRPPQAPPGPLFPADHGQTDGTDVTFQWTAPSAGADRIVDYHLELSDRPDLAWPLSANFEKLVSNTADRGQARYTLPEAGLLTPGTQYYWHVRAKNDQGVWGPWSRTWRFTAGGPAAPLDVRLESAKGGDRLVLRWQANPAGRQPVKYRVYGSDEQGFSVSEVAYRVHVGQSKELPAQFPANFVAETQEVELSVVGVGIDLPNANRAFYRVVAVDDKGCRSGPSDFVAAPRPYIHSKPLEAARVGSSYRCQVVTIRSLGDLRMRIVAGKEVTGFWDVERPRFVLAKGPSWLSVDERTGVLSGVPDAPGTAEVVVTVRLERTVRRLDDARLSWGHELVKEVATETVGSATQRFHLTVAR